MTGAAIATASRHMPGTADPVESVTNALDKIDAQNERLNAFVQVDRERSLADARAVAARLADGEVLPLAGAPLGVKDNIWVEGWRATQGSRLFADHIAPRDAVSVARARKAGAVVVGITACSEFACKGLTKTPLYGPTKHPMDLSLTPGGSSGGSAAGLAAGMVALALGTDAGGSGRRPASHCGLVGLKGSLGAIPYGPGFPEPTWDISVIAPMARTVADTRVLFDVMRGFHPSDPASAITLAQEPSELGVIAFSSRFGLDAPVDDDVETAVQMAINALVQNGWPIAERDPKWPDDASEDKLLPLQHAGLAALHGAAYLEHPDLIDPDLAQQIEGGLSASAKETADALEAARQIRQTVSEFFATTDLLIGPTTPCVAWPHHLLGPDRIGGQAVAARGHAVFTPFFNHARNPAISVPCGRGRGGLPVGLQIVGRFGDDLRVLRAAQEAESVFEATGLWSGLEPS